MNTPNEHKHSDKHPELGTLLMQAWISFLPGLWMGITVQLLLAWVAMRIGSSGHLIAYRQEKQVRCPSARHERYTSMGI